MKKINMENLNHYGNFREPAAICDKDKCIVVQGDTAEIINYVAICTAVLIGAALLYKFLR